MDDLRDFAERLAIPEAARLSSLLSTQQAAEHLQKTLLSTAGWATEHARRLIEEDAARMKEIRAFALSQSTAWQYQRIADGLMGGSLAAQAAQLGLEHWVGRHIVSDSLAEKARALALTAQQLPLGNYLDMCRTSVDSLTSKFLLLDNLASFQSAERLSAFAQASAVSDILQQEWKYDDHVRRAIGAFTSLAIPPLDTIQEYGRMLSAAGLSLPRWPHMRLLTFRERRRKLKERIQANAEPRHVKTARSVMQRYEVTLRQILDEVMTEEYGDDWGHARLSLCDCKDLHGKWVHRGGEILDHADYPHYARIMCHPDHFAAIFSAGFDDPDALRDLIKKAGDLRRAVMHFHEFSPQSLRDLRLTWRAIESGLLGLTSAYEWLPP